MTAINGLDQINLLTDVLLATKTMVLYLGFFPELNTLVQDFSSGATVLRKRCLLRCQYIKDASIEKKMQGFFPS